jgi:hypothetical protein
MRLLRGVRSFHDLPLWAKVLIAPAACLTAGAAVAASIWLGATETEGRLADVASNAFPTAAASAQLLDAVDTIQVTAMRAMVWQQAGVPQATIDGLVKDVGRELIGAKRQRARDDRSARREQRRSAAAQDNHRQVRGICQAVG